MQVNIRQKKAKRQLLFLGIISLIAIIMFIGLGLTKNNYDYLLPKRIIRIVSVVISGGCIAFSAVIFQTICNNRILTPSVLGLDSIYSFFQTIVVFIFGTGSIVMTNKKINFGLSLIGMLIISAFIYKIVFSKKDNNIMYVLLVGLITGTFFNSLTSFMQVLIDPNEYLTLQNKLIASFSNVNSDILFIVIILILLIIPFIYDDIKVLDVMSLGKEQAINLGIDYDKMMKKLMIVVAILTAIPTALVGPVTFLSLIVVNITYQVISSYKHKYLLAGSVLISVCSLILGLFLVERVFSFNTTLSIIINFIGGLYFLFILLKERKND